MPFSMDYCNVTIIIPTCNEEKNIGKLVGLLHKAYKGISVIVVDDNSADRTCLFAKDAGAFVLDRKNEPIHGLCISVIEGIMVAKTQYCIVMDGDMQHPYEKVKEIVEKLQHCPIVVGTREQVLNDWPLYRRIMSKLAIFLGHIRLGLAEVRCDDIVSGFFGIKTELFKNIVSQNYAKYELKGYKILFDTLKYLPKGTKIYQLKYDFGLRESGASKINYMHVFYYFRSLFT